MNSVDLIYLGHYLKMIVKFCSYMELIHLIIFYSIFIIFVHFDKNFDSNLPSKYFFKAIKR